MSRNVLVTGGTGGIGFAIAKEFCSLDDTVIITDIDEVKGSEKVKELKDLGYAADFYKVDSTNEEEVISQMAAIEKKYEVLDVLVNCAGGLGGRSRFEGMETCFYRFVIYLKLILLGRLFFVLKNDHKHHKPHLFLEDDILRGKFHHNLNILFVLPFDQK